VKILNLNSMLKAALLVGLLVWGVNAVSADPSQIYVSPVGNDSWDGEFPVWQNTTFGPKLTIKNATGTVTTDGTVYVASGTYNENGISFSRNVNIIGENRDTTIINGTNNGTIMSIGFNRYVSLTNLTFTNGNSTTGGGAIAISSGHAIIDNCIFQNNIAGLTGGAIHSQGTGGTPASLVITNSVFTNNKANGAGWGGAIIIALSSLTVTGSDFIDNIGTSGSAIHSNYGSILGINFNRFIGTGNSLIYSDVGGDATLNWWGSNADPTTRVSGPSPVTVDPWLVLNAIANPAYVTNSSGVANSTTIQASLLYDVYGNYYDPAFYAHVPDGMSATFSSDALGSVSPASNTTINGAATSTFTAGPNNGNSIVTVNINGQPATTTVYIITGPVFNTRTSLVYPNIQPAIDDVLTLDGDTLVVVNGTFTENVDVTKILTITTYGAVVVNPLDPNIPIFSVESTASGSVINGFNLNGATTSDGILLNGPSSCTVSNNTISANNIGIHLLNDVGNSILNNNITNCPAVGIMLDGSTFNTISDNTIIGYLATGNTWGGILINNAYYNVIQSNNITGNTEGVYITGGASDNTITTNNITNNINSGVAVDNAFYTSIVGNTLISGNSNGVRLFQSLGNNVFGNTIDNNSWSGIVIDGSTLNIIDSNYLSGNLVEGMHLMNLANQNTIIYNSVIGNTGSWCGISIWNSAENYLFQNYITGLQEGIYLTQGSNFNNVTDNYIYYNLNSAICLDSNSANNTINMNSQIDGNGNGIRLYQVTDNIVTQNTITNSVWAAICLDNSSNNQVDTNTAQFNQEGIYIFNNSNNNIINGNMLYTNTFSGICINNALNNTLSLNDIAGNGNGIRLFNFANQNNVTQNNLTSQGWAGIVIDSSNSNTLTLNNITTNSEGLYSMNGSNSNLIYTNNFQLNTRQAYDEGTNSYDNGATGNYWSDYGGIGTYPIQGGSNVDNFPTTTPF
jgi:parallel beta-helix repeat protein